MQTVREGGSGDSDVAAVAGTRGRRFWSDDVITDTAAGNRRNARLNVSRNSSDAESSDMGFLHQNPLLSGGLTFVNNNCICKYSSREIFKCNNCLEKRPASGYWRLQKLHQGRTQDFVQADKFLSLPAQPRRRADGRAVFQAHSR